MFFLFIGTLIILFLTAKNHFNSISDLIIGAIVEFFIVLIVIGYGLSYFNLIGKPYAWGFSALLFSGLLFYISSRYKTNYSPVKLNLAGLKNEIRSFSNIEKASFGILFLAFVYANIINLIFLIVAYSNEWDSMTGHLVKCAYYLQNGNMGLINGTTWSVDYYPNALPSLQLYFYQVFGEKGFKFIHYLCYWLFVFSIYGISKSFNSYSKSNLFVFLVAGLLPTALIQGSTTETDLVLASICGAMVYFLLKFYKTPTNFYTILLAVITAIWISLKVTFLLVGPAYAVVFLYVFFKDKAHRQKILLFAGTFLVAFCLYVLPNGYLRNLEAAPKFSLGALSAPPLVMQWHGIEGYSTSDKIKNFKLNIGRYSSDFLQFDGIRNYPSGKNFNDWFRIIPNKLFSKFNLERNEFWAVYPFKLMGDDKIHFYVERPYWGIISFGLILPLLLAILIKRKKISRLAMAFILAGIIHFLSLCFSAPYDPIKARYFMNMAVWFFPLLVFLFEFNKAKYWVLLCTVFVLFSAYGTVTYRLLYPLFGEKSIFKTSRMEQLTISRPDITKAYEQYDKIVPQNAIVALGTQQEHEDFEYPLWGKALSRRLIPIHPFRSDIKPIPEEAEYLFFSKGVFEPQTGDIRLGDGDTNQDTPVTESEFYLRKLK